MAEITEDDLARSNHRTAQNTNNTQGSSRNNISEAEQVALTELQQHIKFLLETKEESCFGTEKKKLSLPLNQLYDQAPDYARSSDQLLRFLRARGNSVSSASLMFLNYLNWRQEFQVNQINREAVEAEVKSGKAFWCGRDKQGRPAIIIRPAYHIPKLVENIDLTLKFAIYMVELACRMLEENRNKVDQFVVIYDRTGVSYSNVDSRLIGLVKKLGVMLQDYYAERLSRCFILHVNWLYHMLFKVMSPLMQEKTKNKMVIVKDLKDLQQYFDSDELLIEHGGNKQFDYSQSIKLEQAEARINNTEEGQQTTRYNEEISLE
jgi:hypothetical protein